MKITNGEIARNSSDLELKKSLKDVLDDFGLCINDIVKILDVLGVDTDCCYITYNSESNAFLTVDVKSDSGKIQVTFDKSSYIVICYNNSICRSYTISNTKNSEFTMKCLLTVDLDNLEEYV